MKLAIATLLTVILWGGNLKAEETEFVLRYVAPTVACTSTLQLEDWLEKFNNLKLGDSVKVPDGCHPFLGGMYAWTKPVGSLNTTNYSGKSTKVLLPLPGGKTEILFCYENLKRLESS